MLDERLFDFPVGLGLQATGGRSGSRVRIIDKCDAMPDEHVVFDRDTLADEGMTGYLAAFPDNRVLLDFNERAYLRLVADFTTIEIDELGEFHISPQLYRGSDT